MSYPIDPDQPSEAFLRARIVAGVRLQEMFKQYGGRVDTRHDYRWIKSDLTWPSFDHLTFAYRNQVFSVLIDLIQDGQSRLSRHEITRCVDACSEHNLVPCSFPVNVRSFSPLDDGWNLLHLENQSIMTPEDCMDDIQIEMSEWELRNFCIQITRDHIQESKQSKILSYCDVVGIDPQIWCEDINGNRSWVVVRHYPRLTGDEAKESMGMEKSNPQLAPYDGYLAAISLACSEPFTRNLDSKSIPLSKRFDGSTPIYRGDGFYVSFKGLERVYVA